MTTKDTQQTDLRSSVNTLRTPKAGSGAKLGLALLSLSGNLELLR